MTEGEIFVVIASTVRRTPFGGFTTYTLERRECNVGERVAIGNGHLVLEAVS